MPLPDHQVAGSENPADNSEPLSVAGVNPTVGPPSNTKTELGLGTACTIFLVRERTTNIEKMSHT